MILEGLLARTGAAVTVADNGRRALELWEPGRFDVLLLGIAMPEFDGFNLLRAIQAKAVAHGATPPPAVAVTASSMLDEVADYFAAGFAAYVPKPFMRADLIREISRALRCAST